MLKKAGIVVAAAAAGLLALSPLALASNGGGHEQTPPSVTEQTTVVNETTTSRSPECNFGAAADNSVEQEAEGGDSLLDLGGLASNTVDALNAQTQAPIASCNNVEDVLDLDVRDNFQDNSQDNDETSTSIEDSGNVED